MVFLGVGFETTAPGTAAAVLTAREQGVKNFTVWSMLKLVEPALRALMGLEGFDVQGFLCPGHVGTIIGERGFRFLPEEYGMPAVISGFEPEDILLSVYRLLRQIAEGAPRVENEYTRAVSKDGNLLAQRMLERAFEPRDDLWRGLGRIEASGLGLREELRDFDAQRPLRPDRAARPKAHGLPLRRGDLRAHGPRGLPALRQALHAGGPGGALHGVLRGRLRRGV